MAYKFISTLLLLILLLLTVSCNLLTKPPQAPPIIVITFDDQNANVFSVALPIMSQYGYRGSCFVNSGKLGQNGLLSVDEVKSLNNQYNWEIGGHSLNHEHLPQQNYPQAELAIGDDFRYLQNIGVNPISFAIPFGNCPAEYYPILLHYYQNIRGSIDFAMFQPIDRHSLGYFPYQNGWTASLMKERIRRGIVNHESLVVLGFHRIGDASSSYEDNCPASVFAEIINYIHQLGLEVLPLSEAVDKLSH
ncbi:MAG: polysaccharide deacetylase family protein [Candidatus Cloacimonetes bacterium]|nr:polysaccharide deacetylase family protein [Candidatus Cloacimonadota bacterium]